MPLTLAIVGRPNVGKSTLFNRLAGKQLALVHDTPGVTRDRREAEGALGSIAFKLIDTAGFEEGADGSLAARMTAQTMAAIAEADVCLFVIDSRDGVTAGDEIIAETLRRSGKPVILAANKSEGRASVDTVSEAYRLGFGEALMLSAEHALGIDGLVEALEPFAEEPQEQPEEAVEDRPLRLAIVGRPNVGKSSLFNHILGAERSLTGPEPGLTRDSIAAPLGRGRPPDPAARHRRPAPQRARGGTYAGAALDREHAGCDPLRRLRDRGDRRHPALREAGPDHRRPDREGRPAPRCSRSTNGIWSRTAPARSPSSGASSTSRCRSSRARR